MAPKAPPAVPASSSRPSRAGPGVLRRLLGQHFDDVWGVALVVLAALCALSVYSRLAGPAGPAPRPRRRRLAWRRPACCCPWLWRIWAGSSSGAGSGLSRPAEGRRDGPGPGGQRGAGVRSAGPGTGPGTGPDAGLAPAPGRVAFGAAVLLVGIAGLIDEIDGPAHWRGLSAHAHRGAGSSGRVSVSPCGPGSAPAAPAWSSWP